MSRLNVEKNEYYYLTGLEDILKEKNISPYSIDKKLKWGTSTTIKYSTLTYKTTEERATKIADILGVTFKDLLPVDASNEKLPKKKTLKKSKTFRGIELVANSSPCKNQACPCNEKCMCTNDIVLNNIAPCANKNVEKSKAENATYSPIEINSMFFKSYKKKRYWREE